MVAIGCTGGRHRSVAIAEHLAERYGDSREYLVEVVHRDVERPVRPMIDHVGFEVSDLARSARFYDAVFEALGARRMYESEHAVAYGINGPVVWIVVRGREPGPGYGHMALGASGKAAVDAAHTAGLAKRWQRRRAAGPPSPVRARYYAAYLRDPDGLRVEVVSRR